VRDLEPGAVPEGQGVGCGHGAGSFQTHGMIMSLVRLLSAGKSLVGVQEVQSRYRMNKQMRLPKFISPRNPFVSDVTKDAALTQPKISRQTAPRPDSTAAGTTTKESKRTP